MVKKTLYFTNGCNRKLEAAFSCFYSLIAVICSNASNFLGKVRYIVSTVVVFGFLIITLICVSHSIRVQFHGLNSQNGFRSQLCEMPGIMCILFFGGAELKWNILSYYMCICMFTLFTKHQSASLSYRRAWTVIWGANVLVPNQNMHSGPDRLFRGRRHIPAGHTILRAPAVISFCCVCTHRVGLNTHYIMEKEGLRCPLAFRAWYHSVSQCGWMYTDISRETPARRPVHVRVQNTHTHSHKHRSEVIWCPWWASRRCAVQISEVRIWLSALGTSDPECLCPKGMMLTHPPTTTHWVQPRRRSQGGLCFDVALIGIFCRDRFSEARWGDKSVVKENAFQH